METERVFTAFSGFKLVASGGLETVLLRAKELQDGGEQAQLLIFDNQTGGQIDFDLRGSPDEVLARLSSHPLFASSEAASVRKAGPGRPRLGVVSREVSLLPRHWEWLEQQPQGISAALRRLVDEARKRDPDRERARLIREATAKFMWAMTGNLPGFEEALRALFAKHQERFEELICDWPVDVRAHLGRMVREASRLEATGSPGSPAPPIGAVEVPVRP